ncbi:alpha/beta fold hydrolase [Kriegella aquimaris]|uniref:Pimeloyl-ACP methyl ester carboxylesterase n=1 Tax=Kriegella aquimaris TaxID=192904 RepID=A0A1G9N581_9FLAO|nr:alpha/beta hydrolase [Kriegella aquimaris]SDL81005.1 Pimeloyl-ACP methyl ester carboxylesterase [Kriegella aquimaris]
MKNSIFFTSLIFLLVTNFSCKNKQNTEAVNTLKKSERELKTLELDGYKISYIDIGKGEPVVFVHGAISDYRVWENQMDAFSEKYRVIALSRRYAYPNDQTTSDSNDYSVKAHAKDLQNILQKLNLGPVHLVGHSYGGSTSLVATLENPDLVKSLILLEPPVSSMLENLPEAAGLDEEFANKVVIPAAKAFGENNEEAAVALFIGGVMGDSLYFDKSPQNERAMWLANTTEIKAIASGADLFESLMCQDFEGLKISTLLIKGEHSPKSLRLTSDELHKCIQNSELKELPNASHGLQHQNPEGFNKIVLEFIKSH